MIFFVFVCFLFFCFVVVVVVNGGVLGDGGMPDSKVMCTELRSFESRSNFPRKGHKIDYISQEAALVVTKTSCTLGFAWIDFHINYLDKS